MPPSLAPGRSIQNYQSHSTSNPKTSAHQVWPALLTKRHSVRLGKSLCYESAHLTIGGSAVGSRSRELKLFACYFCSCDCRLSLPKRDHQLRIWISFAFKGDSLMKYLFEALILFCLIYGAIYANKTMAKECKKNKRISNEPGDAHT